MVCCHVGFNLQIPYHSKPYPTQEPCETAIVSHSQRLGMRAEDALGGGWVGWERGRQLANMFGVFVAAVLLFQGNLRFGYSFAGKPKGHHPFEGFTTCKILVFVFQRR